MLGTDEGIILGYVNGLPLARFDGSFDATADCNLEGSSVGIPLG